MLAKQIAWEEECVRRGSTKYQNAQETLKEKGQGDTSDSIKYLLKQRLSGIGKRICDLAYQPLGLSSAYNRMLQRITLDEDYTRIGYIGAQAIFQAITAKKPATVLRVTLTIAKRLEADLKCQMFQAEFPGYYHTVEKSLSDAGVLGYEHKHNVFMKKFDDFDLEWEPWSPAMRVQMGGKVLRCVMEEFWDVLVIVQLRKGVKTISVLEATKEYDNWVTAFEEERGFMMPQFLPLKVPPAPWTSLTQGGYYTPRMRANFPLIKTKSKEHKIFVSKHIPLQHMSAANKVQETAWTINQRVLNVQKEIYRLNMGSGIPRTSSLQVPEFPEHLKGNKEMYTDAMKKELGDWKITAKEMYAEETKRKSQLFSYLQVQQLANELSNWPEFYFAYNFDFRGRLYCATPNLSPQGPDSSRGLLQFAKGLPVGDQGLKWLAIHGATTYGNDKISFDERIVWIRDSEEMIAAIVADPITNYHLWENADKPYQFLAFCFEWGDTDYGRNKDALSSIPIALDGSCNGLQHFSAMLRDDVGAKQTNLVDSEIPSDIYQAVADRCTRKLRNIDHAYARRWLRVGINRKCAKRPVMTLPYGATQQSCRAYILEYVKDNWNAFGLPERYQRDFAKFLTPILWESIGETVVAARTAMKWLRQNTGKTLAHWVTPIGFPVFQCYKVVKTTRIETQICGTVTLFFNDFDKEGEPNKYLQKNGVSPNFIHSIDSTHLVMTVNGTTLDSYAMIHDDFGTHAANTQHLYETIPKTFYDLHANHNVLKDWGEQVGANMETLPQRGLLDLSHVLSAKYFFS